MAMRWQDTAAEGSPPVPVASVGGEQASQGAGTGAHGAAWAASVLSALALSAVLLGYGVALSAESRFGIPHAALYQSAFDLTDLAGYAIVELMLRLPAGLMDWSAMFDLYRRAWPVTAAAGAAWVVVALVALRRRRRQPRVRPAPASDTPRGTGVTEGSGKRLRPWQVVLGPLLLLPLMPLAVVATIVVLIALLAVISVAPLVGLTAGDAYMRDWVLAPASCAAPPRASRSGDAQSTSEPPRLGAPCLKVTRDGVVLGEGRAVFATSSSVLLFDPASGSVRRVPTAESVVEVVTGLSTAPPRP